MILILKGKNLGLGGKYEIVTGHLA